MIRSVRSLKSEALILLLCALFALGGVVQARALGSKLERANTAAHFSLCLPSAEEGENTPTSPGDASHEHACDDCRLTPAPALANMADARLPGFVRSAPQQAVIRDEPVAILSISLPWSTGPPAGA